MKSIITVLGKDRVGIIADICTILAKNNINILDISQTILQEFFTMIMVVDTSKWEMDFVELSKLLTSHGEDIGLSIRIQREDIFNAMHRI